MDSFGHLNTNASELIEWPNNLPTPLISREHVFNNRNTASEMSSSRLRKRRTMSEVVELINVQWAFTNDQFSQFKSFFDNELENGEGNFIMVTYDQSPTPHFVRVVTRELNFFGAKYSGNRDDNLHSVSAVLEVVDSDVYEIENWFDPLPPPVENPLPVTSTDFPTLCRDEFTMTFGASYDLQIETVYGIEVSDAKDGVFNPHIYFALQTDDEKATRIKVLTFNNDYNGAAWFRMVRISNALGPSYEILSQPTNPQASVVPAPVVSISNLTEITSDDQVSALGALSTGIIPLYHDGNFVTPYSLVEDPMIWLSPTYRRAQKKYVQRQQASFDSFGDMITIKPPGVNIITMTGPPGAIFSYTRDQSDPQIDTYMPQLNGLDNNALVQDHKFTGVIKVRCFVNGCRSPLTTVLIDKVMWEIPVMTSVASLNDLSGYCDYPKTDSITGLVSESGNSCNILYGGDCAFEALIYSAGTQGGSLGNLRWNGATLALMQRIKTRTTITYLDWPTDRVTVQFFQFSGFLWNRLYNGWGLAPPTHNWGITDVAGAIHGIGFQDSVCGLTGIEDGLANEFLVAASIIVSANLPLPPDQTCHGDLNFNVGMARFDIIRATQWITNPRDQTWTLPAFVPPAAVSEPPPITVPIVPFDDYESYLDGDATAMTLSFHSGIDWSGSWVLQTGATVAQTGYDPFEEYANGAVADFSGTHLAGDGYVPYNGGEAWEATVEWHFYTPATGVVYSEPWDGYPDGALAFDAQITTVGWMTGGGEGWQIGTSYTNGSEGFDTYADGAFVGAVTGTSFTLSESWIAT